VSGSGSEEESGGGFRIAGNAEVMAAGFNCLGGALSNRSRADISPIKEGAVRSSAILGSVSLLSTPNLSLS